MLSFLTCIRTLTDHVGTGTDRSSRVLWRSIEPDRNSGNVQGLYLLVLDLFVITEKALDRTANNQRQWVNDVMIGR